MRRSWLSHSTLFPVAVAVLVAGNAFDLIGTYVYQPDFQHENNPIHALLRRHGYSPGWPEAIVAKLLVCVICAIGFRQFLYKRREYYLGSRASFREFITQFFYGRRLPWLETFYRVPRFLPTLLFCLAICSLAGPYFAFLGYDNLAAQYGWPTLSGFWVGSTWVDYGVVTWVVLTCAWLCWEMWRDYQDTFRDDARVQSEIVA
jgi:hypothetical protein